MSWHIEGCTGACLACLIEETVRQHLYWLFAAGLTFTVTY
jgi:hypothetical protein